MQNAGSRDRSIIRPLKLRWLAARSLQVFGALGLMALLIVGHAPPLGTAFWVLLGALAVYGLYRCPSCNTSLCDPRNDNHGPSTIIDNADGTHLLVYEAPSASSETDSPA